MPTKVADCAGALVLDLCHDRGEVDGILREAKRAARNRRYERDLVPLCQGLAALDVGAVDGEDEAGGLVAELERPPDVLDSGSVAEVDVAPPRSRVLAQAGEKPHRDSHGR